MQNGNVVVHTTYGQVVYMLYGQFSLFFRLFKNTLDDFVKKTHIVVW